MKTGSVKTKAEDAAKWELTQGNTESDKARGKHSRVHLGISGEWMSQICHRWGHVLSVNGLPERAGVGLQCAWSTLRPVQRTSRKGDRPLQTMRETLGGVREWVLVGPQLVG